MTTVGADHAFMGRVHVKVQRVAMEEETPSARMPP